jgi:hypothetical protein
MSRLAAHPTVFEWNWSPYRVVVFAAAADAARHVSATPAAAAASRVRAGIDGTSHG